ncbi:Protein MM3350-like domain protein [Acididesulfobacillus acetoxydans]|uniref:Plasmid pRiA4b ORF-3 protein n=1 Tax=Acididesulfobacillus acetoxydans TaxID=1561005 RepID=A0A8S0VY48_9FIRM|nr:plasmid pRiA4b ORF-3 family protein [Acididesulfobacillus acetoxydans]CAA7602603.1 Protein MM3350-like domain protein [Acididesulfobacillus acetoxydans]CEJ07250.1 Plasmid pRiA4b ORF-3 protein [Acididesulfobacillus acetoxydans]
MAYQLKVVLRNIEPTIWRRLRIPGNITFAQMHRVIQEAFGWLDYHLYHFDFGEVIVVAEDGEFPAEEMYGPSVQALPSGQTLIDDLFSRCDRCVYEYDFGDSWEHEILIEKRLKESRKYAVPACLDGARQRPPEDVGGAAGYERFLTTIRDSHNPEREELLLWAEKDTGGRLYDPEYFSVREVNRRLEHALLDGREQSLKLFLGKNGLTGPLRMGWSEPYVEMGGQAYSWERIGKLLSWLDEGYGITIKATKPQTRANGQRSQKNSRDQAKVGQNAREETSDEKTKRRDPMDLWLTIPEDKRELLLANCFCHRCHKIVRMVEYTVQKDAFGLGLLGKCSDCGGVVGRFVEL